MAQFDDTEFVANKDAFVIFLENQFSMTDIRQSHHVVRSWWHLSIVRQLFENNWTNNDVLLTYHAAAQPGLSVAPINVVGTSELAIPDHFFCAVCLEPVMRFPVKFQSCNHRFCLRCVYFLRRCPLCRVHIRERTVDRELYHEILFSTSFCTDCNQLILLLKVEDHAQTCRFRMLRCLTCREDMTLGDWHQHICSFEYRTRLFLKHRFKSTRRILFRMALDRMTPSRRTLCLIILVLVLFFFRFITPPDGG